MTTRTTSIQPAKQGLFTLIGATAASLAVIGGVAVWQVRSTSGTATLRGGLSEFYAERAAALISAPALTIGGMAELYAERATAASVAPVTTMGGMAE